MHHFPRLSRDYRSDCQSVRYLLLPVVDLQLPSHCAKSFSSSWSNTSHWSLQRGCFRECWFNSVGKKGWCRWRRRAGRNSWKQHTSSFPLAQKAITHPPLPLKQTSAKLADDSNLKERRASTKPAEWLRMTQLFIAALALAYPQENLKSSCLQSYHAPPGF